MPRPIKFRAWVTEFEEPLFMLYNVTPFYILDGDFNTADRIYGYKEGEEMSTKVKSDTCKFHLMQFTGLTDKNSKEIYEGDLVKLDGGSMAYEIVWDTDGFAFKYKDTPPIPGMWKAVEVIGNIHENPELLEVPDA